MKIDHEETFPQINDEILKIIEQKVLKGTHLSVMIKEIQAGYLSSSYFKDVYLL